MSIEKALADLTTALKENTEAHLKLADVAKAAQASKTPAPEKAPAEKPKAASKAKAEADEQEEAPKKEAAKKPAARKAAPKNKTPDPVTSITFDDLKLAAKAFISPEDESERDARKEKLGSALDHLGASKLTEVDEDDMPKVATYLAYWTAGLDVDFEEIDGLIAEASDDDSEGASEGDDDEMIG